MLPKMTRQARAVFIIACACAMIFLAGCAKGPKRVAASGNIELDGKPLEGGILYFNPDTTKGNTARVNCSSPVKNGHFEVQTAGVERADSGPGMPLGWYKVTVRVNTPGEKARFPGQPTLDLNPMYFDAEKTPLALEVVEKPSPGSYDLKLTSTR